MSSVGERNYLWFKKNLSEVIKKYKGQYLIIHEESLCGAFSTFDEALESALKFAKPGDFLVQHCVDEKESTQVICSLIKLPLVS